MKIPFALESKILSRFSKNRQKYMSNYFRKQGCKIGNNCNIISNINIGEPYLIYIGNDVTISTDVLLLTHDASVGKVFGKETVSDVLGKISIGDNSFIGARTVILPGVTLKHNTIVAAGSVVTKSFKESNIIIGGNPACIIGTWDIFREKYCKKGYSLHGKKGNVARKMIEQYPERLLEK